MGKGKKSVKSQEVKAAAAVQEKAEEAAPAVDTEMEQIEFHTRSLDRLKTIRTGKRKILDIFRQSGDQLDKKLMEQLHERYNEFVCQESEILELLRRTMGLNNTEENNTEADIAVNELCAQIAETNAKLAQAKQKNDKLEREAAHRKTNVKEVEEQRDSLQNRVKRIQQENVNKKQTVLKLLSILRENPEILDKNQKAQILEPGFSCIQAAQSTPGTSKEYEEISKHLESIKARRGRMNAIRERLSQVSAAQTMDDTYQSALKRLEALSTIRKTLEESAATDAEIPEGEEEEKETKTESNQKEENKPTTKFPLETKPPLTSTTSVQLVTDSDGEEEEEEEEEEEIVGEVDKLLLDEVRKEFLSRFENSSHYPSLPPPTTFIPTQPYQNILTQCNCNCPEMATQLEKIEEQLALQNHRLTALHDQINLLITLIAGNGRIHHRPLPTTTTTFQSGSNEESNDDFKHTLLAATPETLHELSGILSDLASGDASSVKSLNSLFKHLGTSSAESKREESKEPIDDETKRAAAISEINSARGKLQKQRTLERVRIFATSGTTSFDKTAAEEPDSNGVEKEICLIVEHVVPWLNKNENEKVTPTFVTELRELIIGMANKICFPAGVNSDLFKTQLTTILDDAILQVADDTFKKSHNAIVSEVSEILYNELTFFKLINDIDSMGVEED